MTPHLDVEVAHRLGVRGDELLARLDVAPPQLLEDVVDRGGVLDLAPEQGAGRRVHGRLPQLVRVHLAETLEAAALDLAPPALQLTVARRGAAEPPRALALGPLVQ